MKHIIPGFIFLQLLITGICPAQQDGEIIDFGTYRIIHSDILDEERTLLVHLPDGYQDSNRAYPVFYMLYGNHTKTYYADCVSALSKYASSGRIPAMILVAVTNTDRYRDLIPFDREGNRTGIDNFAAFFREELFSYIEKNYRTKEYRVLLGPQAGANFALYTLFDHPDLFNAYIVDNPFRWTSGREYFLKRAEEIFSQNRQLNKFFFITHDTSDVLDRQGNQYIGRLKTLVDTYKPQGFSLKRNYIPESDDFIPPIGVGAGLKKLFEKFVLPEDVAVSSLGDILNYYQTLSSEMGFEIAAPGHVLTMQGDKLQRNGMKEKAIEIFTYMVDHSTQLGNAYWRLSEIAIADGDFATAAQYLKTMLDMMGGDVGHLQQRYNWVLEQLKK